MRLIDADAFERHLMANVQSDEICDDCLQTFLDKMATLAPTVDARLVVHARWEHNGDRVDCSACGSRAIELFDDYNYEAVPVLSTYCPRCGAKMNKQRIED